MSKDSTIHIVPANDLIEHNNESKYFDEFVCSCDPEIDYENNMVIHWAMDGRPQS